MVAVMMISAGLCDSAKAERIDYSAINPILSWHQFPGSIRSVTMIGDKFALVSLSEDQVQFYDWSDHSAPPTCIAVVESANILSIVAVDHLLFGMGAGLTIIDASDAEHPKIIGKLTGLYGLSFIATHENLAYFAEGRRSLLIIDLTDPMQPFVVSRTPAPNSIYGATLCWPTVVVSSHNNEPSTLINVSDPLAPVMSIPHDKYGQVVGVGDYFISASTDVVDIYDCSMMMRPRHVATIPTGLQPFRMSKDGDRVCIIDVDAGISFWDASDMPDLRLIHQSPSPEHVYSSSSDGGHAVLYGNYNKIFLYDPDVAVDLPPTPTIRTSDRVGNLTKHRNQLYGSFSMYPGTKGLLIFNPNSGAVAQQISRLETPQYVSNCDFRDRYIFLAGGESDLTVVDAASSHHPHVVAGLDVSGEARDIIVRKNIAYISSHERFSEDGGISIIDISNPLEPTLVAEYLQDTRLSNIESMGKLIVSVTSKGMLSIHEPQRDNDADLNVIGTADAGHYTKDLVVQGTTSVLLGSWEFSLVDCSDPVSPCIASTLILPTTYTGEQVVCKDEVAYITTYQDGVLAFDISNPYRPIFLGGIDPGSKTYGIVVARGRLYVSGLDSTLAAVPLHRPSALPVLPPPGDETTPGVMEPSLSAHPNPLNPITVVEFINIEPGTVSLDVYDLKGRRIVGLVQEVMSSGFHQVIWDGRNAAGRRVPSGTYTVRLEAGDHVSSMRLAVVK